MTVVATDSSGKSKQRTCGVTVKDNINEEIQDEKIEFSIQQSVTSNNCLLTWKASGVVECFLTNTDGFNERVPLEETDREVGSGNWFVKCIDTDLEGNVARILNSDHKVCFLNPDFREY